MTGVDDTGVVGLADRLWQAAVDRRPIEPITRTRTDLTLQDAYAIQSATIGRRKRRTRRVQRSGTSRSLSVVFYGLRPWTGFLR